MANPEHLRELAARMFAIAIRSKEVEFATHLALRASDYLDQAAELEKITNAQPEEQEKL